MSILKTGSQDFLSIYTFSASFSPADSTTYYFTQRIAPTVTEASHDMKMGYDFTVVGAVITCCNNSTVGSAEDSTLYFRNVTTGVSHLMGTFKTNGSTTFIVSSTFIDLNISVGANDFWCYEVVSPAWNTNPIATTYNIHLLCKKS